MKSLMLFCCLLTGCIVTQGGAATIHVPGDYSVIQNAINASADWDVIVLAPGTYYERNIDLSGKAIAIQSENPMDPAATIIDCNDCFSGFIFDNGETASTILDGLTIIHSAWGYGGGLVCMYDSEITFRGSSPTIRNCVITTNLAWSDGAGLYCDTECSPVVENCIFNINTSGLSGGAVSISSGNPVFNNCQFVENSSGLSGGAISIYGGNPIFTNCQFRENSTLYWGGAVYALGGSPVFRNCVIAGNYADAGAAFYFEATDHPQIVGCTVIDNTAGAFVSGVYAISSHRLTIESSIFWGNAVVAKAYNASTIYVAGQIEGDTADIAYCNIQDYLTTVNVDESSTIEMTEGMMNLIPQFESAGLWGTDGYSPGDWHLQKGSPCINKGNPLDAPAVGKKDIDGEDRVMNGRIEIGVDEVEMAIAAKINIEPGKLLVPCKGFVLAMIRLPEGYAVKDIDPKTILWDGKLAARCLYKCRSSAVAVFDLAKVSELLDDADGKIEVTISGQLTDGMALAGRDTVQVKQIHWKNWFKRLYHSACKK